MVGWLPRPYVKDVQMRNVYLRDGITPLYPKNHESSVIQEGVSNVGLKPKPRKTMRL